MATGIQSPNIGYFLYFNVVLDHVRQSLAIEKKRWGCFILQLCPAVQEEIGALWSGNFIQKDDMGRSI